MPCPAPGTGGSLGTAESGDKQMAISSVEEALGDPGVQKDDSEPAVCPDIKGGK